MIKVVYQTDQSGLLIGNAEADESALEPGIWHLPRGCVETPPPVDVPTGKWPRWNGFSWELSNYTPPAPEVADPVQKLRQFMDENPDVAALILGK